MLKNFIKIEKYRRKLMSIGIQNGGHKKQTNLDIFAASQLLDAILAA